MAIQPSKLKIADVGEHWQWILNWLEKEGGRIPGLVDGDAALV
jgi:hypothetical protein